MRSKTILLAVWMLFTFPLSVLNAKEKKPLPKEGWILVWEDEFNGPVLDRAKWSKENADLKKNNEKQFYIPDDVYLKNGLLVLRSREKKRGKKNYTSGLVMTRGKFEQTYGRFEICARLPKGQGIWPAHWLMNTTGSWPPEIDIMELKGHKPHIIHMTNHYGKWPKNSLEGSVYNGPDFTEDFHTFALEWEPDEMRWYIDGIKRFSTKKNIPDVPFYIVLNTAVGGTFSGYPDETTRFPQYHEFDYIRVYKRDTENTMALDIKAENGTVLKKPDEPLYAENSFLQLYAVPNIGFTFDSWNGHLKKNPVKIKVKKNMKIQADFIPDPAPPKLISKNKRSFASSIQAERFPASNACDGKIKTRWSSQFSDPQWIAIDLENPCTIQAVKLCWENSYAREYDIQVSSDGENWKTAKTLYNYSGGEQHIWLKNIRAQYVRMLGKQRATHFGYSLFEFEVYGKEQQ